jgi:ATPase family associated with various cellular activities (AAA)
MTIIFGMTPSLTPPTSHGPPNSSLIGLLMSRNSSTAHIAAEPKTGRSDWGEGEAPEKTREKRLRDRLKKWEKGDAALLDEFPKLYTTQEGETVDDKPEIIFIGGNQGKPAFTPLINAGMTGTYNGRPETETEASFFRASILVPSMRSTAEERAVRVARRREINELTMRMGVGAAGGILEHQSALTIHADPATDISDHSDTALQSDHLRMWEDWGNKVEVWPNVRGIADRAIGNTLSVGGNLEKATLNSTEVPWSAVHKAWASHRSSNDLRKSWLRDASSPHSIIREHDKNEDIDEEEQQAKPDEVIEKIKHDSDLDAHEQRLLPCIVDSGTSATGLFYLFNSLKCNIASMPTSFNQVHLPPHTIDSVRTIVSLPLLHPEAFQQGILKQHGMTGCLLFGPPGTGKTLVVRALAKEAGCRMITISPSDVMDMVRETLFYMDQFLWQRHSMLVKGRNWSRPFSRLREGCHHA